MRALYGAGLGAYSAVALPLFFAKGKHRAGGFAPRFGRIPAEVAGELAGRRVIWIHAVSVGEMALALRLSGAVKDRFPDAKVLLTSTTAAGYEVARRIKSDEDVLLPFPFDFGFAVRSFVETVKPSAVVLLETEIWPNLLFRLAESGVPAYIVNARISDKAVGKYTRVARWIGPVLSSLAGIGAQDERMRQRFLALGAPAERVRVTGNIKFDWAPPDGLESRAEALAAKWKGRGDFLLIAGSTHEGEEEALFRLWKSVHARHKGFRLLVAPRHLTREAAVKAAAARAGVRLGRVDFSSALPEDAEVWMLGEMGILAALYRHGDAAFVGGSLVPTGGHNLVEPAYYEKPVFFGSHTENFSDMASAFTAAGAGVRVRDAAELEEKIVGIVGDPGRRRALGSAAKALVASHQGALQKSLRAFLGAGGLNPTGVAS